MNKRLLAVLGFALLISAAASLGLYKLVSVRMANAASAPPTKLFVAARDLPVGTLVRDLDVSEIDWKGQAPSHAMTKREEIVGRGVVAEIYSGEPFLENRLAAKGAGAGLAATIPQGKRAVAVRVNDVVGLAGFVTPGMRVDVLIMGQSPGAPAQNGSLSRTMLQNIEVLSAGQQIQKDSEGKPVQVQVVNMLVTPEEAEALSLASSDARIQLVLRNPLDKEEVKTSGTALAKLFTGQGAQPPPATPVTARKPKPAAPPPQVIQITSEKTERVSVPIIVEILHGSRKAETKFKEAEAEKPKSNTPPEAR